MTTVQFKKTAAASAVSFDAVAIGIEYDKDEFAYTDDSFDRSKIISAAWKKWSIKLGLISEADMDYLHELTIEEAPQMILNAVTYDVEIERVSARRVGTSIVVINRSAE